MKHNIDSFDKSYIKVVNDRTAKNVVRPNPNGSAISTERSAEQFGRTSVKKTSICGPKISKEEWKLRR